LVVKYSKAPVVTSVTLTPLTAADTPWLTICTYPGLNVSAMELLYNTYNLSSTIPLKSLSNGLTLELYAKLLALSSEGQRQLSNTTVEKLVEMMTLDPFVKGFFPVTLRKIVGETTLDRVRRESTPMGPIRKCQGTKKTLLSLPGSLTCTAQLSLFSL
jgi:hypothetical protein